MARLFVFKCRFVATKLSISLGSMILLKRTYVRTALDEATKVHGKLRLSQRRDQYRQGAFSISEMRGLRRVVLLSSLASGNLKGFMTFWPFSTGS
jgi:hypothetical protein